MVVTFGNKSIATLWVSWIIIFRSSSSSNNSAMSLTIPRATIATTAGCCFKHLGYRRTWSRKNANALAVVAIVQDYKSRLVPWTRTMSTSVNLHATASDTGMPGHFSGMPPPMSGGLARVYVAVGSNLGNRFHNIAQALALLQQEPDHTQNDNATTNATTTLLRVRHTSMLHETAPMYVTHQPNFLNGVVMFETNLLPMELLHRLKLVEAQLGRDLHGGIRNGPRPVDLDIVFYCQPWQQVKDDDDEEENDSTMVYQPKQQQRQQQQQQHEHVVMETPDLVIPHPRMAEREFVLAPLCEVARLGSPLVANNSNIHGSTATHYHCDLIHPILNRSVSQLLTDLMQQPPPNSMTVVAATRGDQNNTKYNQEEEPPPPAPPKRVLVIPLPRDRWLRFDQEPIIMGVLNVTPDSFSDGGQWNDSVDMAVQHALEMQQQGAGIIDIGGESTRPGAQEIPTEQQLARVLPVIQQLRQGECDSTGSCVCA